MSGTLFGGDEQNTLDSAGPGMYERHTNDDLDSPPSTPDSPARRLSHSGDWPVENRSFGDPGGDVEEGDRRSWASSDEEEADGSDDDERYVADDDGFERKCKPIGITLGICFAILFSIFLPIGEWRSDGAIATAAIATAAAANSTSSSPIFLFAAPRLR